VTERKEIDTDELDIDYPEQIPQGSMNHPVWMAAYASAYAKSYVARHSADSSDACQVWNTHVSVATEAADLALYTFIKLGGSSEPAVFNEVKAKLTLSRANSKKRPEGPPFEYGEFEVAKETEKALKVKRPGQDDNDGVWVPKSQIHSQSEVKAENDSGKLLVSQWYATQNSLNENGKDDLPF
jgi:hypothetical protein